MAEKPSESRDSLESILQLAALNEARIPLLRAPMFKMIADVHDGMMLATTPPVYGDQVPTLLVLQSQQYFLGATRLALGGMLSPVFPLLRASLESAAYAILAQGSEDRCMEWIKRDENDATRKAFRAKFTFANAVKKLAELDEELASHYDYLYEASITHGAHPNFAGVMGSITSKRNHSGDENIKMRVINDGGSTPVFHALDAVIRFGAAAGGGFRYAIPKHQPAVAAYHLFLGLSNKMAEDWAGIVASAKEQSER